MALGRYEELSRAQEGNINVNIIVAQATRYRQLRNLQPRLSFTKLVSMQEVVEQFVDLDKTAKKDRVATTSSRLRNMCRHVAQTKLHTPRAPWPRHILEKTPQDNTNTAGVQLIVNNVIEA